MAFLKLFFTGKSSSFASVDSARSYFKRSNGSSQGPFVVESGKKEGLAFPYPHS